MHTQSLAGAWQFRQAGKDEWLTAQVPGGVHTDLLALGRIPDPFVADNEHRVQWVAESNWEYRNSFTCDPELLVEEKIYLVCDGLDTLAKVTLNGQELGQAQNMFVQYRWEIQNLLRGTDSSGRPATNELKITFSSPVRYCAQKQAENPLIGASQAIPGGPYLRKAPCQFGWDWGPQLPPIGIWKDILLEGYSTARFEDVHIQQSHTAGQVIVSARMSIQRWSDAPIDVRMKILGPDGKEIDSRTSLIAGEQAILQIPITHPQLWWPNGYGAQPLYRVEVNLLRADQTGQTPFDRRTFQIGLRTLQLRQQEDKWGRSFEFIVNNVRIFAKGSNWIPADSFPTRISGERLGTLILSAVETHQNMLRVWGGGFYEDELFYDLCDRYGILVWQEFMFSGSVYPLDDPQFLANVQAEVVQNIRRLRHRASLALWCGNNEIEQGWAQWGRRQLRLGDLRKAYIDFFHHILPGWCQTEDPDHSYWPSSPSSGTPFAWPNGQRQGDAHYWEVWHGRKPFTAYRDQYPRFMSEFGFQALPPLATIKTFAEEADWNITSYVMEQHQKNAGGNSMIVAQMLDTFRLPEDFKSLVYLSQVLQSEGIRYGVEHWRRHVDRVAGTLYWQLNDCWPVSSWSSLDYFGRWKALQYAARRFYAPLLLSIEDSPPDMGLYLTNDLRSHWEGTVRWSLETLAGEVLVAGQEEVEAGPQASIHVRTFDFSAHLTYDNQRNAIFIAELWQGEQRIGLQTAFFVPTKHLSLADPMITAELSINEGQVRIELVSQSLARLVELSLDGADAVFSENYFDLPAGRKASVTCLLPAGWALEQVKTGLRTRSVYDSYNRR